MPVDIEKLEALAKAATPGPWNWRYDVLPWLQYHKPCVFAGKHDIPLASLNIGAWKGEKNADYIVAACNAVPELIKMYREADDEAADANSAWQKVRRENLALRERVQTLEKMVDYLAEEFSDGDDQSDCNHPHLACQYRSEYWCHAGLEGQKQCWIRVAEQAAKETLNER